jgi:hypothetical protein
MTTDHDPRTRIVLSWLHEDAHENAERMLLRALDEVDTTPQRRSWWPAWRSNPMSTNARLIAVVAAVLVVAVVGYQFLPGDGGTGGQPTIAPSPGPKLLATGTFRAKGAAVELEATADGDTVTGTMRVGDTGDALFAVDLECARTADDGRVLIAGDTTESTAWATKGTYTAIVLKPGSPVHAVFGFQDDAPLAASCTAFLDGIIDQEFAATVGDGALEPIEGTVEFGPGAASSEASASVAPSDSGDGSLPVGPHLMDPVEGQHGEDRVTVTIPTHGWFAPDEGSLTKDLGGGDRVTVVVAPGDYYTVPRDICDWATGDAVPEEKRFPGTADEVVAYLAGQTFDTPDGPITRDFSAAEDITIDGSHGLRIMDAAPEYPSSDPGACDEERYCTLQDRDGAGCLLSHPEPGALDTLWVVEPDGEDRIYFLVVTSSGSPSAGLRDEMHALVDSMTFFVE